MFSEIHWTENRTQDRLGIGGGAICEEAAGQECSGGGCLVVCWLRGLRFGARCRRRPGFASNSIMTHPCHLRSSLLPLPSPSPCFCPGDWGQPESDSEEGWGLRFAEPDSTAKLMDVLRDVSCHRATTTRYARQPVPDRGLLAQRAPCRLRWRAPSGQNGGQAVPA